MSLVTVSFVILDDLNNCFNPIHVQTTDIRSAVQEIARPFLNEEKDDRSGYYFSDYYDENKVVKRLQTDGYYCRNRFEKYYVIAWALNYTRFEVFSKDCEKQLISWNLGHEVEFEGEIKGIIDDNNYNENPVISLLRKINNE